MKANWTHALCDRCWGRRYGERIPHRIVPRETEVCCDCGVETRSGIYYRHDPAEMACSGAHD